MTRDNKKIPFNDILKSLKRKDNFIKIHGYDVCLAPNFQGIYKAFDLLNKKGFKLYNINIFGFKFKNLKSSNAIKTYEGILDDIGLREEINGNPKDCVVLKPDIMEIYINLEKPEGFPDITIAKSEKDKNEDTFMDIPSDEDEKNQWIYVGTFKNPYAEVVAHTIMAIAEYKGQKGFKIKLYDEGVIEIFSNYTFTRELVKHIEVIKKGDFF